MYTWVFNRFLSHLDAESAHEAASHLIRLGGSALVSPIVRGLLGGSAFPPVQVFGRELANPVGVAAGFDKNATMANGLSAMGFGFVEIGTVTAQPQPGNERPRLFRERQQRGLRNRMGFNNDGADVVAQRLARLRRSARGKRLVLGVNIGKSKVTPHDEAQLDYAYSAKKLARFADYLVINVSSPNTPGLRDLQAVESLKPIVTSVQRQANYAAAREVPVLIKISPDLADSDIQNIAQLANELGLYGVSAVNTTIAHDLGPGGLSGPALYQRGIQVVRILKNTLNDDKTIIGIGGISTPGDAQGYLDAGATLIQAYTGFIYSGPRWASRIVAGLASGG